MAKTVSLPAAEADNFSGSEAELRYESVPKQEFLERDAIFRPRSLPLEFA